MAEAKITRAERLINRLVNDRKITKPGADWLVACIDPFHDTQLKELQGWPDVEVGPSVVRCVKQSFQLSVPGGIAGNWDCHVTMWPWHSPLLCTTTSGRENNFATNSATIPGTNLGGIQVWGVPAGTDLDIMTSDQMALSSLNQTYTQGSGRLVGVGFEITNTTSALNRQGTAYVYKHMQAAEEPWTLLTRGAAALAPNVIVGSPSVSSFRYPPRNAADLMLIPGSRQWAAEEGCYVVGSFHSNENKPVAASYTIPVVMLPPGPGGGDDFESPTLNTTNLVMPRPTQSSLDSTTAYYPAVKLDPVHQGGALFAGLSNSTTLTFNTIHYYESFPGLSEPDILVLATPSAEYDSDALNIYSHSLGTMPVGVKVGENGLGDWFAGIVSKIGGFLAPFLGPVLGTVAQVGAGMANQYLASQSPSGAVLKSTQAPTVPKKKKTECISLCCTTKW